MDNRTRLLIAISFLSALLKILLLTLALSRFQAFGLNAYPLIGIIEVALVEIAFQMFVRESYLKWCFGRA
jgi:hypothetical protein